MEWNKVMNFGDPSTFGTEMADRFVASGANLPPPVSNRVNAKSEILLTVKKNLEERISLKRFSCSCPQENSEVKSHFSLSFCQYVHKN